MNEDEGFGLGGPTGRKFVCSEPNFQQVKRGSPEEFLRVKAAFLKHLMTGTWTEPKEGMDKTHSEVKETLDYLVFRATNDLAAVVNTQVKWIPVDHPNYPCPEGSKVQLINEADRVAVYAVYWKGDKRWTHWQGMPDF